MQGRPRSSNYEARNPYGSPKVEAKSLLSSISSISSISSSERFGRLYVPAQERAQHAIAEEEILRVEDVFNVQVEHITVETHDHALLDTVQITPRLPGEEVDYCVIKFNGNGGFYQDMFQQMAEDAVRLQSIIVGFNYRNVNLSEKAPLQFIDLQTDGIAQLNRVLDLRIPANHITLDGVSLGGSVATSTAAFAHGFQNQVYLFNDRSFSTLTKAAVGILAPHSNLGGGILTASVAPANALTGWSKDVAADYNTVPAKFKSYMYIEPTDASADGVIAHQASLHVGVEPYENARGINTAHPVLHQGLFGHNANRTDLRSTTNPKLTGRDIADELVLRHRKQNSI